MRPDEEAPAAAVDAARQVLADAGHDLDPLTVTAALTAAANAHPNAGSAALPDVLVTGLVGDGLQACTRMALATNDVFAAAADTYLRHAGAEHFVEQHVTGRDGTRYVITFHQPHGRSPDELVTEAEATVAGLRAAIGRLADRLEARASATNVLSVRAALREVCQSLRSLLP